jgi:hypothetical protein
MILHLLDKLSAVQGIFVGELFGGARRGSVIKTPTAAHAYQIVG